MNIALYQPEIPQNVGSILRTCACMNVPAHIIHPCSFPFDKQRIGRSLMDYGPFVSVHEHLNWQHFLSETSTNRKILLDVHGETPYYQFSFAPHDILIAGSENSGFAPEVYAENITRITIPMRAETRSLNVAMALSMALGEALRQTRYSR